MTRLFETPLIHALEGLEGLDNPCCLRKTHCSERNAGADASVSESARKTSIICISSRHEPCFIFVKVLHIQSDSQMNEETFFAFIKCSLYTLIDIMEMDFI